MSDTAAVRLNIGGGSTSIPGYDNWDIKQGNLAHQIKVPDGSLAALYASHVLEHYRFTQVDGVVAHWASKLKPGGVIHIAVPDAERIDMERRQTEGTSGRYQAYAFGGGIDQDDHHGCMFDEKMLHVLLKRHGFEAVERFAPFVNDCSQLPVSLNITATKRHPFAVVAKPKVMICLSQPRLSITATTMALIDAVRATCFDHCWESSIYWEKGISTTFKRAIEAGYDYVMTVDYDGIFRPDDVHALVKAMQERPDLAAVFPVQMSRHENKPLVFQPELDYTGDLTVTPFGHFGLTLIRTQMLKSLPKPWMCNIPGPDGDWESHPQSDADITFWRNLTTNGYRIAQANKVILGHLVECVRWPTNYGSLFQPLHNYLQKGKPETVVFNAEAFRKKPTVPHKETPGPSLMRLQQASDCIDKGYRWLVAKQDGWQCGEQRLLAAIAEKLEIAGSCSCLEIGAGDGNDLPLSCQRLIDMGGRAYVVDCNPSATASLRVRFANNEKVTVIEQKVTPGNVGSVIGFTPSILLIDVDSTDYYLWKAIENDAKIVMVEHHNLGDLRMSATEPFVPPYPQPMSDDEGHPIQANYVALDRLARDKGYTIIARTFLNSIYARDDVAVRLLEKADPIVVTDYDPVEKSVGFTRSQPLAPIALGEPMVLDDIARQIEKDGSAFGEITERVFCQPKPADQISAIVGVGLGDNGKP